MRRSALATAGVLTIAFSSAALMPASGSGTPPTVDAGLYIVVLRGDPAAVFEGEVGQAATAPAPGHRFRSSTPAVEAYAAALLTEQQRVRESAGIDSVVYSYTTAIDGFAAELTSAQVKALASDPRVASVQPDRLARVDGTAAPITGQPRDPGLGVANEARAWRRVGGVEKAGRGVVVGVIDTGIWPDNPSFAGVPVDRGELRRAYPGFSGTCEAGERWSRTACTSKIVSARYFVDGFGASDISAAEYLSPRDGTGHGSHVAAIAAGNAGVDVTIDGQEFGRVSGVAPDAALAVYKACWAAPDPSDDGCSTADTVAAVDQAVADGVDVLNFSASTRDAPLDDAVEVAFLNAASAGVFVATSAGDGGPAAGSVAHTSPWVTTAAATTQAVYEGGVRLGNGRLFVGSMASDRSVPSSPLVYGRHAAAPGATVQEAAWCEPGSLDAKAVDGAVVLCDRGQVARVSKSAAVEQAGGVAMVLANDTPGPTDIDVHSVPTVHVRRSDGRAIKAYLAHSGRPRAALDAEASAHVPAGQVADFSGRGPVPSQGLDTLKPDLAAPGVAVVSAVAPASDDGRLWDISSGTSMAAPQLAGEAALVLTRHPMWSAAAVKSAMMTTAGPTAGKAGPFMRGAGVLRPARALDPGLVYDAGRAEWLGYLRGLGSELSTSGAGAPLRASDLNQASIAIGGLVGEQTVTRRVTNVSGAAETFTARPPQLRGIAVRVSPPTLRLARGESARFDVTFTARRGARYGEFTTGALTWRGSRGHLVSTPVVVQPQTIAPATELALSGSDGRQDIEGRAGVTGVVRARLAGPVAAQPSSVSIPVGAFDSAHPDEGSDVVRSYALEPGTAVARFEVDGGFGDVDLYAYRDGRLVAAATGSTGDEVVTLERPPAGSYEVYLVAPESQGQEAADEPVEATYTGWVVPNSTAHGLVVDRRTAVTGGRGANVAMSWSGLADSQRWFGEVRYRDATAVTHVTINE
jgi:hypothetical protein